MKIAVVGAAGLLGAVTVREWRDHGHEVAALTRTDLDVTIPSDILRVLGALTPDVIINCTAYNRVDDAEDDPTSAFAVNAWAVRSLARAAAETCAVFVHYSTDFVFDGETDRPYTEEDAPNPQSAYGMSKLVGEWMALEVGRAGQLGRTGLEVRQLRQYVLRVESLFGGSASRSTIDRMLETLVAGRSVTAFSDRTVSPSHVVDVASATRELVIRCAPGGVYHCVNTGLATWLEVAELLRECSGSLSGEILSRRASSVTLAARRPQFAALSNARVVAQGITMPHWTDALKRHLSDRWKLV